MESEIKNNAHHFPVRVYYEDTDAGEVVYHTGYIRFAERARTELLRTLFGNQSDIREQFNLLFVVKHMEVDYLAPARLDDLLTVKTTLVKPKNASLTFHQQIWRTKDENNTLKQATKLIDMKVVVVAVGNNGKPKKLPTAIRESLNVIAEKV